MSRERKNGEFILGIAMHYYGKKRLPPPCEEYNMAQLSDTLRLRNLAVSLDGVKVVGYQNTLIENYQQIENDETNNIIGEFHALDINIARYCGTNNLQLRSCVVDFNRMVGV